MRSAPRCAGSFARRPTVSASLRRTRSRRGDRRVRPACALRRQPRYSGACPVIRALRCLLAAAAALVRSGGCAPTGDPGFEAAADDAAAAGRYETGGAGVRPEFFQPDRDGRGLRQGARKCPTRCCGSASGFVEIGTVTPKPQTGNPRPRLFRLERDEAIINRMGFTMTAPKRCCGGWRRARILTASSASMSAPTGTPPDRVADYVRLIETFAPVASYFTVNVSSPTRRACAICSRPPRSTISWRR